MDYLQLMNELLEKNMSELAYTSWLKLLKKIKPVWHRPTSSSGKYHNKEGGRVPTIAEHTYEMLYACTKVSRLFGIESKSVDSDLLLLAISLHDAFKYGESPELHKYTDSRHDSVAASKIDKYRDAFSSLFTSLKKQKSPATVKVHNSHPPQSNQQPPQSISQLSQSISQPSQTLESVPNPAQTTPNPLPETNNASYTDLLIETLRFHQGRWSTEAPKQGFDLHDYHPYTVFIHILDMLSANNCLKSNHK